MVLLGALLCEHGGHTGSYDPCFALYGARDERH